MYSSHADHPPGTIAQKPSREQRAAQLYSSTSANRVVASSQSEIASPYACITINPIPSGVFVGRPIRACRVHVVATQLREGPLDDLGVSITFVSGGRETFTIAQFLAGIANCSVPFLADPHEPGFFEWSETIGFRVHGHVALS